MNPDDTER